MFNFFSQQPLKATKFIMLLMHMAIAHFKRNQEMIRMLLKKKKQTNFFTSIEKSKQINKSRIVPLYEYFMFPNNRFAAIVKALPNAVAKASHRYILMV